MRFTVCCKASTHIGLGHLIRTRTFISQVFETHRESIFEYIVIGDKSLLKLINFDNVNVHHYESENDIKEVAQSDVLVLDMLDIEVNSLNFLKTHTKKTVVFSPIFSHFDKVDYYFGRTKYLNFEPELFPNLKIYAGLEYAIIQEDCVNIGTGVYEENLKLKNFPIAIIMGGGDANNKTLSVIKALKECRVSITFWVMIGEGYKHSLDTLIEEIRKDKIHEIILAKTNASMWHILKNCVMCVLPGGITSFEAVYAGLPAINFFETESQRFLLREIVDENATFDFGVYSPETLGLISNFIEDVYYNRKKLFQTHINTKMLIDLKGTERIINKLIK